MVMAQIQFPLIKKVKIGRPEHSLTPHPATSDNISFFPCPSPPPPPPQSGRHMCITPYGLFTNLPKIIVARDFSKSSFKLKRGILPPLTKQVS